MKHPRLLYCLIFFFGLSGAYAQQTAKADSATAVEVTFVRWVAEFPPSGKENNNKSFFGKVGEFVFGKKPVVLVNPIAIIANTPREYWVLDKKTGHISLVTEQKATPLKNKDKESHFASLVGFCRLPDNSFLVTDSQRGRIYRLPPNSKKVGIFGDTLSLEQPTGIAYNKITGEIWVLETRAHRITILNDRGERLQTIGSRGNQPGQFNFPTHIWIDSQGKVYIVDSMNFRIQLYNSRGEWRSMFGKAGDATGYFARPKGVATDSHGNIYVADALFHSVQIFNSEGDFLYNFGRQGRQPGDFWLPNGIYIDSNDYIYIADSYNSRVQVFQLINHE